MGAGCGVFRMENWWVGVDEGEAEGEGEAGGGPGHVALPDGGRWAGTGMGRVAERRSLQAVETCWKLEMAERAAATRSAQRAQAARWAAGAAARSPMRWSSIWSGVRWAG